MRSSDWSSDGCSSDLVARRLRKAAACGVLGSRFKRAGFERHALNLLGERGGREIALRNRLRPMRLDKVDDVPRLMIVHRVRIGHEDRGTPGAGDRKSTRLNSSH